MKNSNKYPNFFLLTGAGIAAFVVYYAGNLYGPRFTYDSVNYLYAGHSLWEKGRWLRPFGEPYFQWPPLYTGLIAINFALTGSLLKGIFYFQVFTAAITVWLSGRIAYRFIEERVVFYAAYLAIVFSTPVLVVNHFIWSESFFVLLLIMHMSILINYLQHKNRAYWYFLIITGSLLCLQRHVGVFLMIGAITALWLYELKKPLANRIISTGLYGFLSGVPLLGWWLRNYIVQKEIINDYSGSLFTVSFIDHWLAYHDVFTAWFLPDEIPAWIRIVLVYSVIVFLLIQHYRYYKVTYTQIRVFGAVAFLFTSYFLLTYIASLIVNEFVDDRILAPAYIPGILMLFYLIDSYIRSGNNLFLKKVYLSVCLLWTIYPITRTIVNAYTWHHQQVDLPVSQPVEAEFDKFLKW